MYVVYCNGEIYNTYVVPYCTGNKCYTSNNTATGMQQSNLILLFVHQKKIISDNTAIFSNITELILLDYVVVVQQEKVILI